MLFSKCQAVFFVLNGNRQDGWYLTQSYNQLVHIQSLSVHCTSCWILSLCWLIVWMMTLMLTVMFFSSSYLRFTCRYMSLIIQIWVNRSTVMCVMLAALIWTWWYDTGPYILTRNHSSVSTVIIKRAGKKISKRTSSFTLVSMYTVEFSGEQHKCCWTSIDIS